MEKVHAGDHLRKEGGGGEGLRRGLVNNELPWTWGSLQWPPKWTGKWLLVAYMENCRMKTAGEMPRSMGVARYLLCYPLFRYFFFVILCFGIMRHSCITHLYVASSKDGVIGTVVHKFVKHTKNIFFLIIGSLKLRKSALFYLVFFKWTDFPHTGKLLSTPLIVEKTHCRVSKWRNWHCLSPSTSKCIRSSRRRNHFLTEVTYLTRSVFSQM